MREDGISLLIFTQAFRTFLFPLLMEFPRNNYRNSSTGSKVCKLFRLTRKTPVFLFKFKTIRLMNELLCFIYKRKCILRGYRIDNILMFLMYP